MKKTIAYILYDQTTKYFEKISAPELLTQGGDKDHHVWPHNLISQKKSESPPEASYEFLSPLNNY